MKTNKGLRYCLSFDTKEIPGKIVAIQVTLDKFIFGPNESVRVDLVDHPLYHHLETYVRNNPSRKPDQQATQE